MLACRCCHWGQERVHSAQDPQNVCRQGHQGEISPLADCRQSWYLVCCLCASEDIFRLTHTLRHSSATQLRLTLTPKVSWNLLPIAGLLPRRHCHCLSPDDELGVQAGLHRGCAQPVQGQAARQQECQAEQGGGGWLWHPGRCPPATPSGVMSLELAVSLHTEIGASWTKCICVQKVRLA